MIQRAIVRKILESDFYLVSRLFSTICGFGINFAPLASQGPKCKALIRKDLASINAIVN